MAKTYFTKTAAAKAAAPKTAARSAKAKPVEVADEVCEPATPFERLHQKVHGAYAEYLNEAGVVGPKQRIAAWVCGALVAFGIGYLGGWVSAVLMIATLAVTGSMFLGMLAYILGVLCTIVGGAWLGTQAHELITSIDIKSLRSRVSSWFDFSASKEVSHA